MAQCGLLIQARLEIAIDTTVSKGASSRRRWHIKAFGVEILHITKPIGGVDIRTQCNGGYFLRRIQIQRSNVETRAVVCHHHDGRMAIAVDKRLWSKAIAIANFTGRLSEEMIPLVTVFARPNGEPIARTGSPTLIFDESPIPITGRLPILIFNTARS